MAMIPRHFAAVGLCLVAAAGPVRADNTVTFAPVQDNTIFLVGSDTTFFQQSDGAGPTIFSGQNNLGNIRRGLVEFSFTGQIPAGATITSVSLQMALVRAVDTVSRNVALHRVTQQWGEGASVAGGFGGGQG